MGRGEKGVRGRRGRRGRGEERVPNHRTSSKFRDKIDAANNRFQVVSGHSVFKFVRALHGLCCKHDSSYIKISFLSLSSFTLFSPSPSSHFSLSSSPSHFSVTWCGSGGQIAVRNNARPTEQRRNLKRSLLCLQSSPINSQLVF
jgi:hypothetical protein